MQKIILPLSTQIALNSFFGTTHLSVDSGKAQATLKAKVSKSISASVESLGIKTDILTDRVEAIEGMKESQNIAYATEKGYQLCLKTVNSMVSKFKLKGKTLVNLASNFSTQNSRFTHFDNLESNTIYTVIYPNINGISHGVFDSLGDKVISSYTNERIVKFNSMNNTSVRIYRHIAVDDTWMGMMLINGDHTQNPPSYFEGMQSVGHGANEIEVLSRKEDGNLADSNCLNQYSSVDGDGNLIIRYWESYNKKLFDINYSKNTQYTFSYVAKETTLGKNPRFSIIYTDGTRKDITSGMTSDFAVHRTTSDVGKTIDYITTYHGSVGGNWIVQKDSICINKGTTPIPYQPYKAHKKHILYKNDAGQWTSLAKHELREWDTVEEVSDGYRLTVNSGLRAYEVGDETKVDCITDMTNTVYKLAQAKVYEVNNLALESYANETAILLNSGVIIPSMEFEVNTHIGNYAKVVNDRLKALESEVFKEQSMQNALILDSDMRIMDIELALMGLMPMITLNLGGMGMQRGYNEFMLMKDRIKSGEYTSEYLEKCINKYKQMNRLTDDEYNKLYDMIYPPIYDTPTILPSI